MKKLIGGNFKMYKTISQLTEYLQVLKSIYQTNENIDVMIAPMMLGVETASQMLKDLDVHLGIQNIHAEEFGAFTGEASANTAKELGVEYAIIGHSERRTYFGETNASCNEKIKTALKFGLRPIYCIGETLEQNQAGVAQEVLAIQLKEGLKGIEDFGMVDIAYEPVWAIGTGLTATSEIVGKIHGFIRSYIGSNSRIIYGGSVKPENASELIKVSDVDGFLIGGASLDPQKFMEIINQAK